MSDRTTADAATLSRALVTQVLDPMKRTFIGKDEIIDLMGVAMVAGENLFLLGPPGTAKSALVHELGRRLHGNTFEYLLTRFTEPNELFGPFDIRRLREGELITNTEGMLPEASVVFLDELLNANSAILNSLLMVLNERVFRRGRETRSLPTLLVLAASNRLPEDEALGALFDRFLVRAMCENVPGERLVDVLHAGWRLDLGLQHGSATGIDVEHVRTLQRSLPRIDLSAVVPQLSTLVVRLRTAGLPVSDRRAVKMQRLVAASAMLCGRETARSSDLWVFRHIWDTVEQQEVLRALVDETLRQAPAETGDHPRAAGNLPDAEELVRDLDALEKSLRDPNTPSADHPRLQDRLSVLTARSQWVADESKRAFVIERTNQLWQAVNGAK